MLFILLAVWPDTVLWRAAMGAAIFGALGGVMSYRHERGRPLLPPPLTLAVGLLGLGAITYAVVAVDTPAGTEWLPWIGVYGFMLAAIFFGVRGLRRG